MRDTMRSLIIGPDVTDRDGIAALIGETKPEIVYHLAAQSQVQTSWVDPIGTLRSNVEGTQSVLDAPYDASVRRILVVTSEEIDESVTPEMQPDQTGWEPRIPMEDSLRDILEDARKRLDHRS